VFSVCQLPYWRIKFIISSLQVVGECLRVSVLVFTSDCIVWRVEVVVTLANTSNFICDHTTYCHPNCYERQRRSCVRLMTSLRQVYHAQPPDPAELVAMSRSESGKDSFKDKMKRRVQTAHNSLSKLFPVGQPNQLIVTVIASTCILESV